RLARHVDGARAAMAGVAADMRTGYAKLLAQHMNEQHARLGQGLDSAAVQGHSNVHLRHRRLSSFDQAARARARPMARRTMVPATWVRNSAGPRPSADGAQIALARCTASPIAAASTGVPSKA